MRARAGLEVPTCTPPQPEWGPPLVNIAAIETGEVTLRDPCWFLAVTTYSCRSRLGRLAPGLGDAGGQATLVYRGTTRHGFHRYVLVNLPAGATSIPRKMRDCQVPFVKVELTRLKCTGEACLCSGVRA